MEERSRFTPSNYYVPQLVRISAAEDANQDSETATFRVLAPGIATYDLLATTIDNDSPSMVVSNASLSVNEGSTDTFTVRLANAPAADVSVTVARPRVIADVNVSSGSSSLSPPRISPLRKR